MGGSLYTKKDIGKMGERAAATVLQRRGFRIVNMNLHSRYGELDIVAQRDGRLHIIEVKTRRTDAFGHPHSAFTHAKFLKMRKTVAAAQRSGRLALLPVQYDFASVFFQERKFSVEIFWNLGIDDVC